jgi:hypothetical protein
MYISPLFHIAVGVNMVLLNKVKGVPMVNFDDMKKKADKENWDNQAKDKAMGKFNQDNKQRQQDQKSDSED